eukprot:3127581-Prymnesium_polylepis.1
MFIVDPLSTLLRSSTRGLKFSFGFSPPPSANTSSGDARSHTRSRTAFTNSVSVLGRFSAPRRAVAASRCSGSPMTGGQQRAAKAGAATGVTEAKKRPTMVANVMQNKLVSSSSASSSGISSQARRAIAFVRSLSASYH